MSQFAWMMRLGDVVKMETAIAFDDETERVIRRAQQVARRRRESCCGTEHLLLGLLQEVRHVREVARELGFADHLLDAADYEPRHLPSHRPPMSPRAREVIDQAVRDAARRDEPANVVDLSWALLQRADSGAATWLAEYAGTELATFREAVHGPSGTAGPTGE